MGNSPKSPVAQQATRRASILHKVDSANPQQNHSQSCSSRQNQSLLFLIAQDRTAHAIFRLGKAGTASELHHKTVSGELHKQIKRLMDLGLIEMTISDKPNSRIQKYRLTAHGRSLLAK